MLYRTAIDARALSEVLSERQVLFVMKEKITSLYDHFIGMDIMSYLHLSQGHYERKYFLRVANRPKRYISRDSMREGKVSYESLRNFYCDKDWMMDRIDQWEWDMKMLKNQAPYAAIQYIRKGIGYDEFLREYAAGKGISEEDLLTVLEEIQQNSREYQTIEEWFVHVENYKEMLEKQKAKAAGKQRMEMGLCL